MAEDNSVSVGSEDRFRIRAPDVAFQVIDDEAILIHFERGAYYSARGTGSEILKLIDAGCSAREIASELAERSRAPLAAVTAAVYDYITRLAREELIVPDEVPGRPATDVRGQLEPFEFGEAELVKYTDLEDLLLLDPIHDVDDSGWPPHVEKSTLAHPPDGRS